LFLLSKKTNHHLRDTLVENESLIGSVVLAFEQDLLTCQFTFA